MLLLAAFLMCTYSNQGRNVFIHSIGETAPDKDLLCIAFSLHSNNHKE